MATVRSMAVRGVFDGPLVSASPPLLEQQVPVYDQDDGGEPVGPGHSERLRVVRVVQTQGSMVTAVRRPHAERPGVAVLPPSAGAAVGQDGGDEPVGVQRQPRALDGVAVTVERRSRPQHQPQDDARRRGDQHRALPQAIDRV